MKELVIQYHKLVRDDVPEMIKKSGRVPTIRYLEKAEFYDALRRKLQEEVADFLSEDNSQELIDILEVVYALAQEKGLDALQLERMREERARKNGTFSQQILLESVCDKVRD